MRRIATALLALALLGGVVAFVGGEETARALERSGPVSFLAVGGIQAVILILQAMAWSRIGRSCDLALPFPALVAGTLVGQAVNVLTPSAYLGGEPARVIYVGRATGRPCHRLAGTVVLVKVWELLSFVVVFGLGTLAAGIGYRRSLFGGSHAATGTVLVVLAVALIVLGVAVVASLRRGAHPLTGLVGGLCALLPRRLSTGRLRERCREMEDEVIRAFARDSSATVRVLGLLFATHLLILLRPGVFFLLGAAPALNFRELCLIFVVGQALFALQLTPSSVGTLDVGLLSTFSLVGLSVPDGLAFLLCVRLWDAVTVGAAAWVGARRGVAWRGRVERHVKTGPAGAREAESRAS